MPNPGNGHYQVSGVKPGAFIEVYTYTGLRVYSGFAESDEFKLDISTLNPGIYILNYKYADNSILRNKLIKE